MNAGYIRQSKGRDSDLSPELQKRKIEELYKINEWYMDIDYSGKTISRPEFQRLLKDCKSGKIKEVIVYKISRFGRSISDFFNILQKFSEWKVELRSATEPFDTSNSTGKLIMGITALFAEYENEVRSSFIRDAQITKVMNGRYPGGVVPYGYEMINKNLIINKEEAEVVKKIFYDYLSGRSMRSIAIELYNKNVPNRSKGYWWATTIRQILINPIYTGYLCYNKRSNRKVGDKNILVKNEKANWIMVKGIHEPIIDKVTFDNVQKIVKGFHIEGKRSGKFLLIGLIKCGYCGLNMRPHYSTHGKKYIICPKRREFNSCKLGYIQAEAIENAVIEIVRNEYRALKPEFEKKIVVNKEKELEKLNKEVVNLVRLFGKELIDEKIIEERIEEINKRKQEIMNISNGVENKRIREQLINGFNIWDKIDFEGKKLLLRTCIRDILIYGKNEIEVNLLSSDIQHGKA